MKALSRRLASSLLIIVFLSNALPCGPGYTTPLFDTTSAPESPYTDFAAGSLGIIKPTFHRSVLFTAYRYIAGGGLNAAEQQAMIDVWKAEFENKDFQDNSIDSALKVWVSKRSAVVAKEEKPPDIYAERSYGSYDFFPNCTKNAFETAAETLSDRSSAHGPSDPNVIDWVHAQDQVFQNCASGKQTPADPAPGAPEWLQKDHAYQRAAAEFYSLDYEAAKRHFEEIAQDTDSPWQDTADYLVARTLVRQASLSRSAEKAGQLYDEAEIHLQKFIYGGGKFSSSAEGMMGLIKYRRRPAERVSELAKHLTIYGGNEHFRQEVIDYNWLLDKFASQILKAEEKRKGDEQAKRTAANTAANSTVPPENANTPKKNDRDLTINITTDDYQQSWVLNLNRNATDDEALAAAESLVGRTLTDGMKTRIREARRYAYAEGFKEGQQPSYEGGYYGEEKLSPSLIPGALREDDLTDWLFTFQMSGAEAYLYSLARYKATGSEIWLMTALSKAEKSSAGLSGLIEAANRANRTSPAYTTIAYHAARILLETGKSAEATKLTDEMLNEGDRLPVSARNSFLGLRRMLVETLEDFITFSLRKPFAFDFDGEVGSVDEMIAEAKKGYDPEYNKDGREAFEREIDDRYKDQKEWQGRLMFDTDTVELFNQHFPTSVLIEVERSPALPDYMRERFAMAIWTRSYLVDDMATMLKITPDLVKYRPEFAAQLQAVTSAKTQAAMDHAVLYFVLKNPILSPYVEDGVGKTDNEQGEMDSNDWWCGPYESDGEMGSQDTAAKPKRPPSFLTPAQSKAGQAERKRLSEIGDAPKFLAEKVKEWAAKYPADRRLPEALYIAITANGWTKYGCGNNMELHDELAEYLKKNHPNSEWTAKLVGGESEK